MNYILIVYKHLLGTLKESLLMVLPLTMIVFIIGIIVVKNKKNLLFNIKLLLLSFIVSLIVYVTLLSRVRLSISNPLAILFKGWNLFIKDGNGNIKLDLIAIENTFMLLPFTFMFFETFKDNYSKLSFKNLMLKGLTVSLSFTVTIEMLQLVLKLGTTQFSDIVYNTIGGLIGSLLFYI